MQKKPLEATEANVVPGLNNLFVKFTGAYILVRKLYLSPPPPPSENDIYPPSRMLFLTPIVSFLPYFFPILDLFYPFTSPFLFFFTLSSFFFYIFSLFLFPFSYFSRK
jgi:hypothetical protein